LLIGLLIIGDRFLTTFVFFPAVTLVRIFTGGLI